MTICQALHSIEEYIGRLWDVYPPAKFVTSLISDDNHLGFIIFNIGVFILMMVCWFFVVHKGLKWAGAVIWFWVIMELLNGAMHMAWSISDSKYEPGLIMGIFLVISAFVLMNKHLKRLGN